MKVTGFALTIVLSTTLMLGYVFGLVAADDEPSTAALVVSASALMVFIAAGLFFGVLLVTSGRDPRTPDGRRFFQRGAVVLGTLVAAAIIALVVVAVLGELAAPVALALVGSGLLYVALNVIGGEFLRRRDERLRPTRRAPSPLDEDATRRRIRLAALLFVGVLLVGVLVTVVVALVWGDAGDVPPLLGLSVLFAALAAGFSILNAIMTLNAAGREVIGTDTARAKRIGRLLRGKDVDVSPEERDLAIRYAPIARSLAGWNLAQFSLLYVGLFAQNLGRFLGEKSDFSLFSGVFSAALVIVGVTLIPMMLRQRSRIDRFIATYDDGASRQSDAGGVHSPR
jgi:MFS family permease